MLRSKPWLDRLQPQTGDQCPEATPQRFQCGLIAMQVVADSVTPGLNIEHDTRSLMQSGQPVDYSRHYFRGHVAAKLQPNALEVRPGLLLNSQQSKAHRYRTKASQNCHFHLSRLWLLVVSLVTCFVLFLDALGQQQEGQGQLLFVYFLASSPDNFHSSVHNPS
jgi:hypothetical protein